jgi:Fe-S cluster assembly protein SufD
MAGRRKLMMAQATKEKTVYADPFRSFAAARAGAGEPAWVAALRAEAFASFEGRGFPTTDDEDWKYTNVAPLARREYRPADASAAAPLAPATVEPFVYDEARASRLVFVNGLFAPTLSSLEALPAGVVVADIGAALSGEHGSLVREKLGSLAPAAAGGAFASLNAAFFAGGAFIHVPRGVRVESPVQLLFLSAAGGGHLASPRLLVVAGRESEVDIIESYAAAGEGGEYLTNTVAEVFVGDGARVTHVKVQDEGEAAYHVGTTQADVGRDAVYDLTTVTFGSKLSRHDIAVRLGHENGTCHVDGLYLVGDGQHADTHSLIDHGVPRCASRQTYKGILDGKSRAVFNGRVFVHEGAHQTDAQQSNKNLLLSREARVDTKPQLEIYNDDVKCSHGATVGQLEEEELFYLISRGLNPALARNLLTYGFAEELVEKIRHESIRRQLDGAILNRLRADLDV